MSIRLKRVNSQMQTELMNIIKTQLKDSRLEDAIITVLKVDTSADFSHARINFSIFTTKDKQEVFNALLNSVPFIRKTLAKQMRLRIMPQLHFILDESLSHASKIDNLIEKIKKD